MPKPYAADPEDTHLQPAVYDPNYVEIFVAQIGISAVLNLTLRNVIHRPVFPETKFLDDLCDLLWGPQSDEQDMLDIEMQLKLWQEQLPPSLRKRDLASRQKSPLYSVASEQVAGTESLVKLLAAGRRLQLAQANDSPSVSVWRPQVVTAGKELINSYVQLGSAQLLKYCDMREFFPPSPLSQC